MPLVVRTHLDNVTLGGFKSYDATTNQFLLRYKGDEQSPKAVALGVLARLDTIDAARVTLYKAKLGSIESVVKIVSGELNVQSGVFDEVKGCKVKPVVAVDAGLLAGTKRIYLSKSFFDMAADDQAGAMLGALFVWEQLSLGKTDLRGARYLNAWLANQTETISAGAYQEALQKAGFPAVVTAF